MTDKQRNFVTFSSEEYSGHTNDEIHAMSFEIKQAREKIKELEDRIFEIQSKCVHEYKFYSWGPYEDDYKCCLCGHDTER